MADKDRRVTRGMPNNVEAEQSVLGSVLIDNKAADILIPMLSPDDFYLAANRIIFGVMKELQEASTPIDTVSVADALELKGKLNEVGSVSYLSSLAEGVPSAANGEYYASIVKRDSLIRRVIYAGNEIAKFGYECTESADALANAEKLVYAIAEESSPKELLHAEKALTTALKNIQDVQTGNVPRNVIFTKFPGLDSKTKGFKPGEMVLLAARPSVGKTALALNIAANACLEEHKTIAIFSLEMPDYLLVKRMLAYVSKIQLTKMDMRGGLSPSDTAKLYNAYRSLLGAGLFIDDYSLNSPSDILSKCRRLKRERGLDMVIIDYLQLMSNSSGGGKQPESRQQEVSDMSRRMKIYAKELDVPILLLSQMSRSVDQRNDHSPKLSDLRESGAIEQDADIVMFLHKESKYNPAVPENQIKLIIEKNRNGPCGELTMEWDGDTTSFREMAEDEVAVAPPAAVSGESAQPANETAKPLPPFEEIASERLPFSSPSDSDPSDEDAPPFDPDNAPAESSISGQSDDEYIDDGDDGDLEF